MCTEGLDDAYLELKLYLISSRKEWKEVTNLLGMTMSSWANKPWFFGKKKVVHKA